ncbi:hypothetical protein VNO78_10332 [Psophocarpus tetragonolobus]|uniref:Uncharacterized protein n=1 Tax=Psophocarpus tetragonolobus TaxID=3891 RepID=A0AAN9SM58_PSOTE
MVHVNVIDDSGNAPFIIFETPLLHYIGKLAKELQSDIDKDPQPTLLEHTLETKECKKTHNRDILLGNLNGVYANVFGVDNPNLLDPGTRGSTTKDVNKVNVKLDKNPQSVLWLILVADE